jgi:hypothetical protein
MHLFLISFAIVAAIALIHFAYIDFRFRYRDGMLWFWMLNPAPPLMWVGRGSVIAAALAALVIPFAGATQTMGWIIGGLLGLHVVSLILLEVLEPR